MKIERKLKSPLSFLRPRRTRRSSDLRESPVNGNHEEGSESSDSDSSSSNAARSSDSELEFLKKDDTSPRKTRSSQQQVILPPLSRRERDLENGNAVVASGSGSKLTPVSPTDQVNLELEPDGVDEDWTPMDRERDSFIRRSTRMRNSQYHSLNQSWILGGGGGARGYPTRLKERNASLQQETDENDDHDVEPGVPEDEVNGEVEEEESSDDMYGRVKDPRRRRSSRQIINYRENVNSMEQDAVEPVSRRLRKRVHTPKKRDRNLASSRGHEVTLNTKRYVRRLRARKRITRMRDHDSSSSSSSSSDSDNGNYCKSKPSASRKHDMHKEKERNTSRNTFMGDIQPLAVDKSISFASVGGLDSYVNKMKEIVIFPLIYKEFFASRKISPPRGILFHGPPGTGKTLLARALANECSIIGGRPVSFFMRKGADILNKWIGESERQLKLLFEQASLHQPSIIFFDELDGLAPVRSAKTDQVHNSIVSTLLAELDGVKDRGEIIVIGATNRVDSIDPALRRPGRFDHEFAFFLPSHEARRSILNVHLKEWKDSPVGEYFVDQLADMTVGYSGADLRLLCSEANMCALRRRYPQIYSSNQKLVLNYSSIQVERRDWETAMTIISRSSDRSIFSSTSTGTPLAPALRPIMSNSVRLIREKLDSTFPYHSIPIMKEPSRKRLLVFSESLEQTEHVLPAVLHTMDSIPVYTLSIQSLALNESDGKGVALLFGEATKRSTVSVIYIPNIDKVYQILGESGQQILLSELSKTAFSPVLILASAKEGLPEELAWHFIDATMRLSKPSSKERMEFFKPIFEKHALQVKSNIDMGLEEEVLPVAPPEIKTWTPAEISALEKTESRVITQLKIFLRETIHKIARMKKFVEFTKPVNIEEVPDYLDIIERPMDLETMMCKVNQGAYLTKADFNKDIELIVSNALNYNPARNETDMRIRHRAFELRDFVFIELEEMDSDFDEKCCNIRKAREERDASISGVNNSIQPNMNGVNSQLSSQTGSETLNETRIKSPKGSHSIKRRRISSWSKGITPTPKKFAKKIKMAEMISPPASPPRNRSPSKDREERRKLEKAQRVRVRSPSASDSASSIQIEEKPDEYGYIKSNKSSLYGDELKELLNLFVEKSRASSVRQLLELRFDLLRATELHSNSHDKRDLIMEIKQIFHRIKPKERKPTTSSSNPS